MKYAFRVMEGGADQDCVFVAREGARTVLVLADGAPETASGEQAAELVCACVREAFLGGEPCSVGLLEKIDQQVWALGGMTTATIVEVSNGVIWGVSVGDSEAWMFADGAWCALTEHPECQALLGSGEVEPVMFGPLPVGDRVVVASDGLWKYAPRSLLFKLAELKETERVAHELVEAVRLGSGVLQDDTSVIVLDVE